MGWAYCGTDYYGREIGYGIPATCDRRGCDVEIDRGLAYVCGEMHHGPFDDEPGCGRYYCEADRGWLGARGGCRHRGKRAWGTTKCQLLRDTDLNFEAHYYCACHDWKYEGPDLDAGDQRKEDDRILANPNLVPSYMEHVERRGFSVYKQDEAA